LPCYIPFIPHLLLSLCLAFITPGVSQVKPTPTIISKIGDFSIKVTSPLPGQAIQGNVIIQGETNIEGFVRAELSFAYQNDPTDTWFFIRKSDTPAKGELFNWDTTSITDGNYQLRLIVFLDDGRQSTLIIPNLRVRNYSPIETNTPAPPRINQAADLQSTPCITPRIKRPTPTASVANPLALSQNDIYHFFSQGAIAACIIVITITLVNAIKNSKNKH
jgi:hypothetical protein